MQDFQKAPFLDELWGNVVQFGHTDGGRFAHVRVIVTEGAGEGIAQIFGNAIDTNATHGPDGQSANEWIGITGVLDKGVDGQ